MHMLEFLIIVLSAVWVYFDAKSIGVRKGQTRGLFNLGPGGWVVATLLLWVIAFPAYLLLRGKFKRQIQGNVIAASWAQGWSEKKRRVAALIGNLIFGGGIIAFFFSALISVGKGNKVPEWAYPMLLVCLVSGALLVDLSRE